MRAIRFRFVGMVFYTVLVICLVATDKVMDYLSTSFSQIDVSLAIIPILSLGAAFFTSEGIGYLFNSLFLFLANIKKGYYPGESFYSLEWENLSYNLKKEILERCHRTQLNTQGNSSELNYKTIEWYGNDVFLSYYWQQAPKTLADWVSRRHTAYFTGMTTVTCIISALLLSLILSSTLDLGLSAPFYISMTCFFVFTPMILYNSLNARLEARHMINLWLINAFDPSVRCAFTDISKKFSDNN